MCFGWELVAIADQTILVNMKGTIAMKHNRHEGCSTHMSLGMHEQTIMPQLINYTSCTNQYISRTFADKIISIPYILSITYGGSVTH